MDSNDEIKLGLRSAGVPEFVFGTTLLKENSEKLRQFILGGAYSKGTGVFLYPAKPSDAGRARKLFFLVAKEMFLSGTTVFCFSLLHLVELLNADEYSSEHILLNDAKALFIMDFYEDGAAFPLSSVDAAAVRSSIKRWLESGRAVSVLTDKSPEACVAWWPRSLLGLLEDKNIKVSV